MGQTKIELEFIDKGFQQILSSSEVHSVVMGAANTIAARAGEGFEAGSYKTSGLRYDRPAAYVRADTYEARKAEAEDKSLSRAVASCRR